MTKKHASDAERQRGRKKGGSRDAAPKSAKGGCTAFAPRGTRCKFCGQVHPL